MALECVVVMPVYNEAGCIREVCAEWLATIQARGNAALVVVDDGSNDGTGEILDGLAANQAALTVIHQPNAGHGPAILCGYRATLATGCEWVFQVDSDGQFFADDFYRLWACAGRSAFVLGSRVQRQDRWYRVGLSNAHRVLLRCLFGTDIADPNIPFRLMRSSLLARLLNYVPPNAFAPNVLLAVLASRSGQDPCNVPVRHRARATGTASIRPARIGGIMLRCLTEMVGFRCGPFWRFKP
ncbi:MAG: glycosyltransferase family 2 protein [Bryobacteraceae bacterium]